jgi:hypothetical protein
MRADVSRRLWAALMVAQVASKVAIAAPLARKPADKARTWVCRRIGAPRP